jgi:hypothetical protein
MFVHLAIGWISLLELFEMEDAKQYIVDELGRKRLANTEIVLPVCIGQ